MRGVVPRRRRATAAVVLLLFASAVAVAAWPASRRIGVDFVVTDHTLPFWVKTLDFLDRDVNLRRTARQVLREVRGDEPRAFAALAWTRQNIRPQPRELPTVDDHVWHVIVRGYGQPDQQADVFTTLLNYQDVRAYWMLAGAPPHERPLSYVLIDGRWRVFDVEHGIAFRTAAGELATAGDLASDQTLAERGATGVVADVESYVAYFENYRAPEPPDVTRADLQMLGPRVLHETRTLFGLARRTWQIRAEPLPDSQRRGVAGR
jgi:hypothetical protein